MTLRYVDENATIQEKFIRFVECDTGTSAPAITEKIKTVLSDIGLDISNIRGQRYDGASNMSGKCSGVAKMINDENPLAIFIHCFAHWLNLCVSAACNIRVIKNMMDKVRCVSEFFAWPKRAELLTSYMKELTPKENHETLLDVCKTRWVARIDGLDRFEDMYEVIMVSLQHVRDDIGGHWNDDSKNLAASLFSSLSEFSFLISLVVAKYFLSLLLPPTSGLQKQELDIKKAYTNVAFVKKSLKESSERNVLEKIHTDLYERATYMADFVGSKPHKPRVCGRMQHRSNHPLSESIDYYRASVTIPFLDYIIREIDERFGDAPVNIFKGFSITPSVFINNKQTDWKDRFVQFAGIYRCDLPGINSLQPELLMWEVYWRKQFTGNLPTSISDTLKLTHTMSSFPNIYAALRVLATLPITSCE